ncbi:DUF2231 domain-containing protein [Gordonia rhizosphera]|uniref:DUF2231 domain-containing protein n=1 Tax=Gordonia rhizosphera NBRC 16068 TaxID=1108045 RepID=K6V3A3_9ACTN|nr:DUF2231 domain-containing protein [Gordonia rhizosphera]GAB90553.1 hypothetical protein GORHZ_106_00110 [Gordonia rhizosphera NBRC 16068]
MQTINGIPAHPLFVHFVVVAIPVAAILAIVVVAWPRARNHLGIAPALIALAALVAVPLTTSAGESLQKVSAPTDTLERHAELGDTLIYAAGPLFIFLTLWWMLFSPRVLDRVSLSDGTVRAGRMAVGALTIVFAVLTMVLVVLIGDSGAQAVWAG